MTEEKFKRRTPIVNAFRCKLCGKVVAPVHRSKHLIVAHKLNGTQVKTHFADLGRPFIINPNAKSNYFKRMYEKNLNLPDEFSDSLYQMKPKPFKLLFTPMGNKR